MTGYKSSLTWTKPISSSSFLRSLVLVKASAVQLLPPLHALRLSIFCLWPAGPNGQSTFAGHGEEGLLFSWGAANHLWPSIPRVLSEETMRKGHISKFHWNYSTVERIFVGEPNTVHASGGPIGESVGYESLCQVPLWPGDPQ